MTIEELEKYIVDRRMDSSEQGTEIEKAEKILNAKLLRQTNIGIESLSSGINQLNQSLRDGIDSNQNLARANIKYSKRMTYLTLTLVFATCVLALAAGYQAILLKRYTSATHKLSMTAGEQLVQSQLDSALVNRPYIEIRPIDFIITEERDPADATSVFCALILQIKNYSNSIPAAEVALGDFNIGSESRGYLTPQNYPIEFKNISIFPGSVFRVRIGFVMNPDVHIKKYNKGEEDYEIYLNVTYTTVKDIEDKPKHWYKCNWIYSRGQFSINSSETDLVRP